jgi:hypothetical protein
MRGLIPNVALTTSATLRVPVLLTSTEVALSDARRRHQVAIFGG